MAIDWSQYASPAPWLTPVGSSSSGGTQYQTPSGQIKTFQTLPEQAIQGINQANISSGSPSSNYNPPPAPSNKAAEDWARFHAGEGDMPVGYSGEGSSSINDLSNTVRSDINTGYDTYNQQLDQMLNTGLPQQRTAQEGIVQAQYQTGLTDLTGQRTEGMADLATAGTKLDVQKASSLKDIASNLRNQMVAGNVYLGARGAGDSSAANQYSYALNKLGNKQRGDVIAQNQQLHADIADREFKLNNIFNTETNKLKSGLDEKINQISSWFADAQNEIRNMQGQMGVNKGKDLAALSSQALQFAQQQLQMAQQQAYEQKSMLTQWAMAKSADINELKQNLASITQGFNPSIQAPAPINATQQMASAGGVTQQTPYGGGGYPTEEDKNKGSFGSYYA